jgi:hypothetical protein
MAGYSGTPLLQKLGIKPGNLISTVNPPASIHQILGSLPEGAAFVGSSTKQVDVIISFEQSLVEYKKHLPILANRIKQDGMIWIAWPKKASGVATDMSENQVRDIALPRVLVDIKVCAIDETWSGLKLVIRKANRAARAKTQKA